MAARKGRSNVCLRRTGEAQAEEARVARIRLLTNPFRDVASYIELGDRVRYELANLADWQNMIILETWQAGFGLLAVVRDPDVLLSGFEEADFRGPAMDSSVARHRLSEAHVSMHRLSGATQ